MAWLSPINEREYREWIADGNFDDLLNRKRPRLTDAFAERHPALIATGLSTYATCYYTRGAVRLLDQDLQGWHDIQCGYWAAYYSLRFEIKAVTLPAWSTGREISPGKLVELVMTSALARVFKQTADAQWLAMQIREHVRLDELVESKSRAGRSILSTIIAESAGIPYDALLDDRRNSCRARDAWPTRPTEVTPFGVIDVEMALHFPEQARFPYDNIEFLPTSDDMVEQAIVEYFTHYGVG